MAKHAKLDPDTAQTALDVQQMGFLRVENKEDEEVSQSQPQQSLPDREGRQQAVSIQGKALLLQDSTGNPLAYVPS